MNLCEFVNFIATPNEKHTGIAIVKLYGKIVLRYKITPTKDGNGFFPNAASYKIVDEQGERYISSFTLDSVSEKEEVEGIIKANVKKHMTNQVVKPQVMKEQSIFDSPPSHGDCPF